MDLYKMRTNDYLLSLLEWCKSEGEMYLPDQANGCGLLGDGKGEYLYMLEGNLSTNQTGVNTSTESYNYGGFTIWSPDGYHSAAIINNISISGTDSIMKGCIDTVNGKADSMYDNVKDVVDRLPAGFALEFWDNNSSPEGFSGLLAEGESVTEQGDNDVATLVYKFNSSEVAQHYAELSNFPYNGGDLFIPNASVNPDVKRDGVFVTVVITSRMPTPTGGTH